MNKSYNYEIRFANENFMCGIFQADSKEAYPPNKIAHINEWNYGSKLVEGIIKDALSHEIKYCIYSKWHY